MRITFIFLGLLGSKMAHAVSTVPVEDLKMVEETVAAANAIFNHWYGHSSFHGHNRHGHYAIGGVVSHAGHHGGHHGGRVGHGAFGGFAGHIGHGGRVGHGIGAFSNPIGHGAGSFSNPVGVGAMAGSPGMGHSRSAEANFDEGTLPLPQIDLKN